MIADTFEILNCAVCHNKVLRHTEQDHFFILSHVPAADTVISFPDNRVLSWGNLLRHHHANVGEISFFVQRAMILFMLLSGDD